MTTTINGQPRSEFVEETTVSLTVARTGRNALIFTREDGKTFRMAAASPELRRLWDFLNGK